MFPVDAVKFLTTAFYRKPPVAASDSPTTVFSEVSQGVSYLTSRPHVLSNLIKNLCKTLRK